MLEDDGAAGEIRRGHPSMDRLLQPRPPPLHQGTSLTPQAEPSLTAAARRRRQGATVAAMAGPHGKLTHRPFLPSISRRNGAAVTWPT